MSQQQTEANAQKPESWPEFQERMKAGNLHRWYRPQAALIELSPEHHPEHKNVQYWRYKEAQQ